MSNSYFQFKQFIIHQGQTAMKVGVDGVMLGAWVAVEGVSRVLDVGTGTGLIALMLAQRLPMAQIDAVEIDADACQQAHNNIMNSPWPTRIKVTHADFLQMHKTTSLDAAHCYDLIVSNPPYFVASLKSPNQQRSMARHSDGLPFGQLIAHSQRLLRPHGQLAVILPVVEMQQFAHEAQRQGMHCVRQLMVQPRANKPAHRILSEWTSEWGTCSEHTMCIEEERHQYTEEYKALTKEFYLDSSSQ